MSQQTIVVLDLEDYHRGGAPRARFVQSLGDALVGIGFFALENHGVDPALVDRATEVAEAFFRLPEATKRRYELAGVAGQRGYTSLGREHAKDQPVPDLKEFWHVGRDLPEGHPLTRVYAPNVWPEEVPAFREVLRALYQKLEACSERLLEAAALYLGEDASLFRAMAEHGDSVLRVLHYPPVPDDAHPAAVRAAAHEDINLMTLLSGSTAPGLELLQRDGQWRPVSAVPGQIIVDSGDMMQQITNGVFKSTTHRVVNPDDSRERRLSMPFFVHPRHEVDLGPLPSCVARSGGVARYPRITAGAFLSERLRAIGLGAG